MKITNLLFPAVLLIGAISATSPPEVLSLPVVASDYDELNREYIAAVTAHEEAEGKSASHPASAFWPRFEALSKHGDGESKLWLVSNMSVAKIVKPDDRKAALHALYVELTSEFNDENWFGGVLAQLSGSRSILGEEATLKFYDTVIEETIDDNNLAGALFFAGRMMKRSKNADLHKRGEAYIARVEQELGRTSWIKNVKELRAWEAVQVGRIAPNFDGKTIDGFEFNLEEYRGQVVLLDFYGFW